MELWKILAQCLGSLVILLLGMLLHHLWIKHKDKKRAEQTADDREKTEPAQTAETRILSPRQDDAKTTVPTEDELSAPKEGNEAEEKHSRAATETDLSYLEPQIKQFLIEEKHFADPDLNISDLAQGIKSNRTYVWKFFTQQGTSFNTYISELRSEYAANLLRSSNISVNEAGMQAGFRTTNTFIQVFKKIYGVTPKQYQINKKVSDS